MSSGQEVGTIFGDGAGPATAMLRSPTVIIASIALWGMNVCIFRLFGIDYVQVLMLDLKREEAKSKRKVKRKSPDHSEHEEDITTKVVELTAFLSSDSYSDDEETDIQTEDSFGDKSQPKRLRSYEVTEVKLLSLSAFLIIALHMSSYLWIQLFQGSTIGAVFSFYTVVAVFAILPLSSNAWIRVSFHTILVRIGAIIRPRCSCIHGKPKSIPFVDIFFADAMCSMSKVFFDWGMLLLMASYYPYPVPPTATSIIFPSFFASVPYIIRARQCLISYNVGKRTNDPNKHHHVLNAIKYSTSLFPLIVSAYQQTLANDIFSKQLDTALIILLAINASYSLIWDIVMDWGMMSDPSAVVQQAVGPCSSGIFSSFSSDGVHKSHNCLDITLRPRLRFGTFLTLMIVALDTVLRFSWMLRFYESAIFPSKDAYILCTQFLEIFRRSVWNLLRVEWELIKQIQDSKKISPEDFKSDTQNNLIADSADSMPSMPIRSAVINRERR